ncbi:MAG TPA: nucleotidyltransferase domain-containing protein [Methylomirabilota bacterium]|nr:nucleotidyltransferase domain-containing protein [Methylomirabilota bacterium]
MPLHDPPNQLGQRNVEAFCFGTERLKLLAVQVDHGAGAHGGIIMAASGQHKGRPPCSVERLMDLSAQRAAYARKLDQAARTLVEALSPVDGIERISIFGSYARGRRDLATDLDVLVVWQTDKPFVDRLRFLYGLVQVPVDLDMLCYTPAEFDDLRDAPFLRHIAGEEVVIFEKKSA